MSYQIKLSKLHLNGFRVFENEVALSFDPQLTVLIGNNGAGKTTILDAIAIALMYLRNEITGGKMFEFPVPLDTVKKRNYDVNNSKSEFENALELKFTQTEEAEEEKEEEARRRAEPDQARAFLQLHRPVTDRLK